jgi:hypothetical protein
VVKIQKNPKVNADGEKDYGPPKLSMNPYIFTALLFFFGAWCFYDGWLTTDPDMQEHQLFNRVLSFVLLPWSVYDFFKVKKSYKIKDEETEGD